MKLENVKWNKNNYNLFIKYLISLEDIKYKEFHSKLANTKLYIIGIRVPIMKKIAKLIAKGNIEEYFKCVGNKYYEEVFIYGIVLSLSKEDIFDKYLMDFIKRIDNWAICDSFCSSIKCINKKNGKYWIYFVNLIDLNKEFQTRVSIIVLMNYYLNDNYIDRVLDIVKDIKSDYYYINMAISWLLSNAIVNYHDKVIDILNSHELSKFIKNKTISKINDSYRVSNNVKSEVKGYRV